MLNFTTPAIVLRRIEHADYDIIATFFTLERGKFSVMAKGAKKSVKRFSGVLELFSLLHIVCSKGRGKGMPVLQEASIECSFPGIREDMTKTAYGSYWAELICAWMEEDNKHADLFALFRWTLSQLDSGCRTAAALSVLFQIRFSAMIGFAPNLKECSICKTAVERIQRQKVSVHLDRGGLICEKCSSQSPEIISLSKGTIKQLLWLQHPDMETAGRVCLTPQAITEGLFFLEAFLPYHMGSEPRSLRFLKQIRNRNFKPTIRACEKR